MEKVINRFILLFVFLLIIYLGLQHAGQGINFTDEGIYTSAPLRYILGDKPFRDELFTAAIPFDKITAIVFWFMPDISLFQFRLIGLFLIIYTLLLLYRRIVKYIPKVLAALVCLLIFTINNYYGILSPSYNILASSFSCISLLFLLTALESNNKKSILFGMMSGLFLSLATISYPSTICLLIIPLILIFLKTQLKKLPYSMFGILNFILVYFGVLFLVGAFIFLFNLHGYLIEGLKIQSDIRYASQNNLIKTIFRVIDLYFLYLKNSFLITLSFSILGFMIMKLRQFKSLSWNIVKIIIVLLNFLIIYLSIDNKAPGFQLLTVFMLSSLIILIMEFKSVFQKKLNRVDVIFITTFCWSIISTLVFQLTSANIYYSGIQGGIAFIAFTFVYFYYRQAKKGSHGINIPLLLFTLTTVIALLLKTIPSYISTIYGEENIEELSKKFSYKKLQNIKSTVIRVERLERLLNYLNNKISKGDYLLAYNNLALLYFLTDTKSSYALSWAEEPFWPVKVRKQLVDRMVNQNRIPKYVIRMLTTGIEGDWPVTFYCGQERCPVDTYVTTHYHLEKIIYPFEIWHYGYKEKLSEFIEKKIIWQLEQDFEIIKYPDFDINQYFENMQTIYEIKPNSKVNKPINLIFKLNIDQSKLIDLKNGLSFIFTVDGRINRVDTTPAYVYIKDAKDKNINSALIANHKWEQFNVEKLINKNTKDINVGILWNPTNTEERLLIKNLRIYQEQD